MGQAETNLAPEYDFSLFASRYKKYQKEKVPISTAIATIIIIPACLFAFVFKPHHPLIYIQDYYWQQAGILSRTK